MMSWPDRERYLRPLQSLVVSLLLSLVSTLLFSGTGGVLSLKFFDTQVPSISAEELVLPRHARCVRSRLRCNGHSLQLNSYLFRIGRIENPSCSACGHSSQDTSHLILHCPATDSLRHLLFGDSVSLRPLVQTLGSCLASGAPWSSAMPPSLGRGRVTTTATMRLKKKDTFKNSTLSLSNHEPYNAIILDSVKMQVLFYYSRFGVLFAFGSDCTVAAAALSRSAAALSACFSKFSALARRRINTL